MNSREEVVEIDCVTAVWEGITQLAAQCMDGVGLAFQAVGRAIATGAVHAWHGIRDAAVWVGVNVLAPVFVTGANILGYLLDKIFFGSPALRPYLEDGLIPSNTPALWRAFLSGNPGWSPFDVTHPVPDNLFGLLGAGIGIVNFFNHLVTSLYRNINNGSHLLGEAGIFGKRNLIEDKRNMLVRVAFGVLSLPLVLPVITITNTLDAAGAFCKNIAISFGRLVRASYNLLGGNGIFNSRGRYETDKDKDERHLAAKIIFGAFATPFVFVTGLVTNIVDVIGTCFKNWGDSYARLLRMSYNLLGTWGIFGSQGQYETDGNKDKRHIITQVIFGALAAPAAFITALVPNIANVIGTCLKHWGDSYVRLLRMSYNLLGTWGIFGARGHYETDGNKDERHIITQVIFGALAAPFAFITALVSNIVNVIGTCLTNWGNSYVRLLRMSYNLLGTWGIFGARGQYATDENKDERHIITQVIFGALAAPFAFITALVPNIVNVIGTCLTNWGNSYARLLRMSYNLLGSWGIFGARGQYAPDENKDERHIITQVIFGALAAPFAFITALVSNIVNVIGTCLRNWGDSYVRLLRMSYNLLGTWGIFGARGQYAPDENKDERHAVTQVIFGALAAPFAFITALVPNIVNVIGTCLKNWGDSYARLLRMTYNLLGTWGIFGSRGQYETDGNKDKRHIITQVIFGALAAPAAFITALVPNIANVIGTFFSNCGDSYVRLLHMSGHLLGNWGIMGPREQYETAGNKDKRHIITKIIFGALVTPLVAPVALLTNLVDLFAAYFINYKNTILKPARVISSLVIGAIVAVPFFLIRKTMMGAYNVLVNPIVDCVNGREFNSARFLKGVANVLTLGVFGAARKVYKGITGYTRRFGFPENLNEQRSAFSIVQRKFRDAIDLATHGAFPGVNDPRSNLRPMLHVFGFRHKVEAMLKELHDAYRQYVDKLKYSETGDRSMHGFFSSTTSPAVSMLEKYQDAQDQAMLNKVIIYLNSQ